MRRPRPATWIAAAVLLPALGSTGDGTRPARLAQASGLHAGPGSGALLGSLGAETPLAVLDEQGGWLRVRIEGWVPAAAVAAAEARPSAAVPPSVATGTQLLAEGEISIDKKRKRGATGEGVEVWLVPEAVTRGWSEDGGNDRARIAGLEAGAEELRKEAVRAMNLPSLHEATARRDELMKQRKALLDERRDILAALHARHEAEAREAALGSAVAGDGGRYALRAVKPAATCVLYARLGRNDQDVEWIVPLPAGADPPRIDLDETTARGYLAEAR